MAALRPEEARAYCTLVVVGLHLHVVASLKPLISEISLRATMERWLCHVFEIIQFDHSTHYFASLEFGKLLDGLTYVSPLPKESPQQDSGYPYQVCKLAIAILKPESSLQFSLQDGKNLRVSG
jgi:hypothetical protein